MSDLFRYTTWKIPAGWNKLVEAWREKHREALTLRGVSSNSAAVLYILSLVMEKEGLIDPFDPSLWQGITLKDNILDEIDKKVGTLGYTNRLEFVRDAIHRLLYPDSEGS